MADRKDITFQAANGIPELTRISARVYLTDILGGFRRKALAPTGDMVSGKRADAHGREIDNHDVWVKT